MALTSGRASCRAAPLLDRPGRSCRKTRAAPGETSSRNHRGHHRHPKPPIHVLPGTRSPTRSTHYQTEGGIGRGYQRRSFSILVFGFELCCCQARNANPGYGQGWDAYGKRFGSSLATTATANVFGSFLLASAFHQDPRYFVAEGTFQRKIGNAFERVVVTRSDYGRKTPNWSGLLGDLFAESLANSYLPQEERTAGKTFQRYGVRVGVGAGVNIVREYWPYIFKRLGLTKWQPEDPSAKASRAKS